MIHVNLRPPRAPMFAPRIAGLRPCVSKKTRRIAAPGEESVTKSAKRYTKGANQTRRLRRAKNGEGDEVEMVEKHRRRFPAHTDDRAACVAASYLMLRDLWKEAAAGARVEAGVRPRGLRALNTPPQPRSPSAAFPEP
jgi:hypothetical protein